MADNSSLDQISNLAAFTSAVNEGYKYAVLGEAPGRSQVWLADQKGKDAYRSGRMGGAIGRTDDEIAFYAFKSAELAEEFRQRASKVRSDAVTPVLKVTVDSSPLGPKISFGVK